MSTKLSAIIRLYERGLITKEKAYELGESKGLSEDEKQILADILDPKPIIEEVPVEETVIPEPEEEIESEEEVSEEQFVTP